MNISEIILEPWRLDPYGYGMMVLMGTVTGATCGLLGCLLTLRRNAMMGDAISHSVLPGIVVAALLVGRTTGWHVLAGALAAALVCTLLVHLIYSNSRIKEDTAIGIAFTTLFALGIVLISLFAGQVDLDADCVLYGELEWVALEPPVMFAGLALPASVWRIGMVGLVALAGVIVFHKELLVTSFDPGFSATSGVSPVAVHYVLMGLTALTAVTSFNAVGAILVVAMLVVPGATALLLSERLTPMLALSALLGGITALPGMQLAYALGISTAGAMVVVGFGLFLLAWVAAPRRGLVARAWSRQRRLLEPPTEMDESETFSA